MRILYFFSISLMGLFATQVQAQYCLPAYVIGCNPQNIRRIESFALFGVQGSALTDYYTGCPSGNVGYSDRTQLAPVKVVAGQEVRGFITIYPTAVTYGIWVDWNGNNNWFEPGETLISNNRYIRVAGSTYNYLFNFKFTVPSTVVPGTYRLRARMVATNYGEHPNGIGPCTQYVAGEAHDYTLQVIAPASLPLCAVPPPVPQLQVHIIDSPKINGRYHHITGVFPPTQGYNLQWQAQKIGSSSWFDIPAATKPYYWAEVRPACYAYRLKISCDAQTNYSAQHTVCGENIVTYATLPYSCNFDTPYAPVSLLLPALQQKWLPSHHYTQSYSASNIGNLNNYTPGTPGYYVPLFPAGFTPATRPFIHRFSTSMAHTGEYTDLVLHVDASTLMGNKEISFDYYNPGVASVDSFSVAYSTDDGFSYTTLATFGGEPATSRKQVILPTNYNKTRLRFQAVRTQYSTQDTTDVGIDSLVIKAAPASIPNVSRWGAEVYPNPATHSVWVQLPGTALSGITTFSWSNAQGQVVRSSSWEAGRKQGALPIEGMPSGVYFLRIENNGWRGVEKVVVQ